MVSLPLPFCYEISAVRLGYKPFSVQFPARLGGSFAIELVLGVVPHGPRLEWNPQFPQSLLLTNR